MKRYISLFFLISILLIACKGNKARPATAMDTGRDFIRATLNGDFTDAETLLYKDTMNMQLFDSYKNYYSSHLPEEEKKKYRESDYTINKFLEVDSATAIINYSNSYMNKPMEIKIIRQDGLWQIDFKYTSSGNSPIN